VRLVLVVGLALVAAMAWVGLPAPSAGATTKLPSLQCGVNPTTDVRLREDLTCTGGFLNVDGPRVNIDLGGHTLTVTNGTCHFFFECGAVFNAASISHGTIVGDLRNVGRVSHVHVVGNVYINEPYLGGGGPGVLEHSVIRNGRVAIEGPNATVRDNRIIGGGVYGGGVQSLDDLINVGEMRIVDNRIEHSPGAGISLFILCACPDDISGVIAGNTIESSGGPGIGVSGFLPALGRTEISHNTIRDNAGDGIAVAPSDPSVPGSGPLTLTGNRTDRNGGHGIDIEWVTSGHVDKAVVDGGGNRARRNHVAPPCVGVVCSPRSRKGGDGGDRGDGDGDGGDGGGRGSPDRSSPLSPASEHLRVARAALVFH
jgi:hypothetical protein